MIHRIEPEAWLDRMHRLVALRDLVAKFSDESRERQAKYYNKGKKNVMFQIGDWVIRRVHIPSNVSKPFNAKLAPKFEGPFCHQGNFITYRLYVRATRRKRQKDGESSRVGN